MLEMLQITKRFRKFVDKKKIKKYKNLTKVQKI